MLAIVIIWKFKNTQYFGFFFFSCPPPFFLVEKYLWKEINIFIYFWDEIAKANFQLLGSNDLSISVSQVFWAKFIIIPSLERKVSYYGCLIDG